MNDGVNSDWQALVIGNSRLHWARFVGDTLHKAWDTPHLDASTAPHSPLPTPYSSLWIASVVPAQSQLWQTHPHARFLTLDDVPLQGMYPTLGVDRALAVWGAIATIGSSALVVDAGTALTFTAANADHRLVGGAILPGLRLQFQSLGQHTATLPTPHSPLPTPHSPLPDRWAHDTESAIASGILHTLIAGIMSFIDDWWKRHPGSAVVLTGGDGDRLYSLLSAQFPQLAPQIRLDRQLIFRGMEAIRRAELNAKEM